LMTQRKLR